MSDLDHQVLWVLLTQNIEVPAMPSVCLDRQQLIESVIAESQKSKHDHIGFPDIFVKLPCVAETP